MINRYADGSEIIHQFKSAMLSGDKDLGASKSPVVFLMATSLEVRVTIRETKWQIAKDLLARKERAQHQYLINFSLSYP